MATMPGVISVARVSCDRAADSATIYFSYPSGSWRTVVIDDTRAFDYDVDGRIVCVEVLNVSRGVKLGGLPEPELVRSSISQIARDEGWETVPLVE